jgi:cytochrome P450
MNAIAGRHPHSEGPDVTEVFDFAAERGACPFDPPPVYERLHAEQPISQMRLWDGSAMWIITRHADVRAVLSDERFSADNARPGFPRLTPAAEALTEDNPTFVRLDPPEHGRLRGMVSPEFTMKRALELRPRIQAIVDAFADRMAAHAPPADLVTEFAFPIPTEVICLILGVPYEYSERFQKCTAVMTSVEASEAEVNAASETLTRLSAEVIEAKAAHPDGDLLSRLVAGERAGELTRDDVIAMARLLMDSGHETTAMMIAYGALALLQNPEQFAAVRDDLSLVAGAVEELLRYLTVIHTGVPRVATADVEIGGHRIRAGDGVLCYLPTANRDDERFEAPDRLDVRRKDRGHLAFGFGIHQCVGQALARIELQVALETLIRRFPDLRLAVPLEELRFRHSMFVEGVHELPVSW